MTASVRLSPVRLDPAAEADLLPWLAAAANWSIDRADRTEEEILADPTLAGYVSGWGRVGDAGLLAVAGGEDAEAGSAESEIVGACWVRLPSEDWEGYGFVAASTPELTIAVAREHQGEGIGNRLLRGVLELARLGGAEAVSLSVEEANGAVELYAREGFAIVGRSGASDIMLKTL